MRRSCLSIEDLRLLEVLTRCVSMMAIQHLGFLCHECGSLRVVQRRVERLVKTGWLQRHTIVACSPSLPDRAVWTWLPNDKEPDAERLSDYFRRRSVYRTQRRLTVVTATSRAANLMGSDAAGLPKASHWNHDLDLASVYCTYRRKWPVQASCWVGEHTLPKAGYRLKDPDAFIVDSDCRVLKVVEAAGVYSPEQVESFHLFCEDNSIAYELW